VKQGLQAMTAVFGRVETIDVAGKPVSILLIKNPAGANEVLRTLSLERDGEGLDLWIALNDRIADGRDVSWVWDADFELLADGVRRVVCAGTRAPEMALRLKYAGWPESRIEVDPQVKRSLDDAVAAAPGRLFALPTYTALLELRTLLSNRGLAREYWE
jgi:UDP-N-acetylmuramyl tripeptide synthase